MKRPVTTQSTGLSLPIWLVEKIDKQRGDISRSRFILRLIEQYYRENPPKK